MTCDIFGTGQTSILALSYLFGKTDKPALSSTTQVTEINTLDQITGKVIDVSRTRILLKALMIPLKRKWTSVQIQFIVPWSSPTSSSGCFSLALEVGQEKALASAGHMTTKHPEFVGVLN